MGVYQLYEVATAKIRPGKTGDAVKWWEEKGKAAFEVAPGTKTVRAYAVQFGFGGEYGLEIWREIDDYGTYDRLDEDILAHPERYAAFTESLEVLEWGPSRLMGDFPESHFPIGEE
ncbi:MAG: hypothetical protein CEE40_08540 [Chloroflexi bacterium B3_Chlor]|nr:MAG: hypothetical protein CEE40_08540 [Chloroflexi bacterium B3_Chlor]